jgi:hypothetical protein
MINRTIPSFFLTLILPLMVGSLSTASAQEIFIIGWETCSAQNSGNTTVPGSYEFEGSVWNAATGPITAADLTIPGSGSKSLTAVDSDLELFDVAYASAAALNAEYPLTGAYSFNATGTPNGTVTIDGPGGSLSEILPAAPIFSIDGASAGLWSVESFEGWDFGVFQFDYDTTPGAVTVTLNTASFAPISGENYEVYLEVLDFNTDTAISDYSSGILPSSTPVSEITLTFYKDAPADNGDEDPFTFGYNNESELEISVAYVNFFDLSASGLTGYDKAYTGTHCNDISLRVVNLLPPVVVSRTNDQAITPGIDITLEVSATGSDPLSYEWQKDDVTLPGEIASNLAITDLVLADQGSYTCTVSNAVGGTTSDPIILSADPFDVVMAQYGLDSLTDGIASFDPDLDGYSNYMEFLLGGNPTVGGAESNLFSTRRTGGDFIFEYTRRVTAAAVVHEVEHSTDLATDWKAAVHGVDGVTIGTSPAVDTENEMVTVSIPTAGSRHFGRLKVHGPYLNTETSYKNFKEIGLTPQNLPSGITIWTYGDFYGDNTVGLFAATITYNPTAPIDSATPSIFQFFRQQVDGTYLADNSILAGSSDCLHPRKALVSDFNNDGRPDVFVLCHGYDASPYPGERNQLVLSQSNGTYTVSDSTNDVGFYHGGASADVNNDGLIDVVAVRGGADIPQVFLNQGGGTFLAETAPRLPKFLSFKNYFTAELLDVNGDKKPDLVVGGHEWEGAATRIYLNPGNFDFSAVNPITIPTVPDEGVVLDFVTTGSAESRKLWILRTSGGDGTFYQSRTVQRVTWPALESTVTSDRPSQWFTSLIPSISGDPEGVGSDDASDNFWITE